MECQPTTQAQKNDNKTVWAGSTKHKLQQDRVKTLVLQPTLDDSRGSHRNDQHDVNHCAPFTSHLLNQKLESRPHMWN